MHTHTTYFPLIYVKHQVVFFAQKHDDSIAFRIWFSIATITASIVLNLGVFTVLVLAHMTLDTIKYRTRHRLSWHWTFVETLRESLIDLFFISLGLLLAIFFHHAIAIGGLGRLAFFQGMLLELVLRVGPRLKIAEHLLEVLLYYKHHFAIRFLPHQPLSRGERGLLAATFLILTLVVTTPLTTSLTWPEVQETISSELMPSLELGIAKTVQELR